MEIEVRARLISLGCIDYLSGESYHKAKQVNLCTTCLGVQIVLNPVFYEGIAERINKIQLSVS